MKAGMQKAVGLAALTLLLSVCVPDAARSGAPKKLADGYPNTPITIIADWGAGGGMGTTLRTLAPKFQEITGVPLNMIYGVKGGNGLVANQKVMKEPADGYTMFDFSPDFVINSILKRGNHDYSLAVPCVRLQKDTSALHVRADSPFKTIQDLIGYAKKNPGKLVFGGIGKATMEELIVGALALAAGIDVKYVSFNGAPESVAALLGGHIDVYHDEPGPVAANMESGQIRTLLVMADKRLRLLPDVPTSVELGYQVTSGRYRGLGVKKGTPEERVKYLAQAFIDSQDTPEWRKLEKDWFLEHRPGGPSELQQEWENDRKAYTAVLKQLGFISE
jgi:tripartite-type tricarboxylate transporter receptor subunit TctC